MAKNENRVLKDSAADMKVINWDEELQVFAVYSIEHRSMHSPKFCTATYRYPNVTRFNRYFIENQEYSAEQLMKKFHQSMIDAIEKKNGFKNKRVERFSAYVDSKFEAIGCAFAKYLIPSDTNGTNGQQAYVVECYLNLETGRDFDTIFMPGPTCSMCDCIEICSKEFNGLCEYRQMRGEKIPCKGKLTSKSYEITNTLKCQINSIINGLLTHFYLIYSFLIISILSFVLFFIYFKHL